MSVSLKQCCIGSLKWILLFAMIDRLQIIAEGEKKIIKIFTELAH